MNTSMNFNDFYNMFESVFLVEGRGIDTRSDAQKHANRKRKKNAFFTPDIGNGIDQTIKNQIFSSEPNVVTDKSIEDFFQRIAREYKENPYNPETMSEEDYDKWDAEADKKAEKLKSKIIIDVKNKNKNSGYFSGLVAMNNEADVEDRTSNISDTNDAKTLQLISNYSRELIDGWYTEKNRRRAAFIHWMNELGIFDEDENTRHKNVMKFLSKFRNPDNHIDIDRLYKLLTSLKYNATMVAEDLTDEEKQEALDNSITVRTPDEILKKCVAFAPLMLTDDDSTKNKTVYNHVVRTSVYEADDLIKSKVINMARFDDGGVLSGEFLDALGHAIAEFEKRLDDLRKSHINSPYLEKKYKEAKHFFDTWGTIHGNTLTYTDIWIAIKELSNFLYDSSISNDILDTETTINGNSNIELVDENRKKIYKTLRHKINLIGLIDYIQASDLSVSSTTKDTEGVKAINASNSDNNHIKQMFMVPVASDIASTIDSYRRNLFLNDYIGTFGYDFIYKKITEEKFASDKTLNDIETNTIKKYKEFRKKSGILKNEDSSYSIMHLNFTQKEIEDFCEQNHITPTINTDETIGVGEIINTDKTNNTRLNLSVNTKKTRVEKTKITHDAIYAEGDANKINRINEKSVLGTLFDIYASKYWNINILDEEAINEIKTKIKEMSFTHTTSIKNRPRTKEEADQKKKEYVNKYANIISDVCADKFGGVFKTANKEDFQTFLLSVLEISKLSNNDIGNALNAINLTILMKYIGFVVVKNDQFSVSEFTSDKKSWYKDPTLQSIFSNTENDVNHEFDRRFNDSITQTISYDTMNADGSNPRFNRFITNRARVVFMNNYWVERLSSIDAEVVNDNDPIFADILQAFKTWCPALNNPIITPNKLANWKTSLFLIMDESVKYATNRKMNERKTSLVDDVSDEKSFEFVREIFKTIFQSCETKDFMYTIYTMFYFVVAVFLKRVVQLIFSARTTKTEAGTEEVPGTDMSPKIVRKNKRNYTFNGDLEKKEGSTYMDGLVSIVSDDAVSNVLKNLTQKSQPIENATDSASEPVDSDPSKTNP